MNRYQGAANGRIATGKFGARKFSFSPPRPEDEDNTANIVV